MRENRQQAEIRKLVVEFQKRVGYLLCDYAKERNVISDLNENISVFYSTLCTITEKTFLFNSNALTSEFVNDGAKDIRQKLRKNLFIRNNNPRYRNLGYQACINSTLVIFRKLLSENCITEEEFEIAKKLYFESKERVLAELKEIYDV